MVDTDEVELPGAATVESGFDRNAVADFPAETLCGLGPGDGALPVLQEVGPLIIGDDQLGKNLPLRVRVDDELRKEIILVLVDAAKPVVVRDVADAGNAQDFVLIGERDQVDDRSAVNRDKAVCAGQLRIA